MQYGPVQDERRSVSDNTIEWINAIHSCLPTALVSPSELTHLVDIVNRCHWFMNENSRYARRDFFQRGIIDSYVRSLEEIPNRKTRKTSQIAKVRQRLLLLQRRWGWRIQLDRWFSQKYSWRHLGWDQGPRHHHRWRWWNRHTHHRWRIFYDLSWIVTTHRDKWVVVILLLINCTRIVCSFSFVWNNNTDRKTALDIIYWHTLFVRESKIYEDYEWYEYEWVATSAFGLCRLDVAKNSVLGYKFKSCGAASRPLHFFTLRRKKFVGGATLRGARHMFSVDVDYYSLRHSTYVAHNDDWFCVFGVRTNSWDGEIEKNSDISRDRSYTSHIWFEDLFLAKLQSVRRYSYSYFIVYRTANLVS